MKLKRIYWFAYYDNSEPSVRYRAVYPLEILKEKYEISCKIIYPGYSIKHISQFFTAFVNLLFSHNDDDTLIVYQKIHTQRLYAFFLKILLFYKRDIILYDTDDADYIRFPADNIHYFFKRCAACSVGSKALQVYTQQYNPNVFLLTSPVISHQKVKEKRETVFTIGWIGYYNAHRENLHTLFFPAILNARFKMKLVLLGVTKEEHRKEIAGFFAANNNIEIEMPGNIDWHDELAVYEYIKGFDLGVSPLIDNEFNRAKSAFKLKQYLSCGVPVLASPVGENNYFLKEGINGYFCDSAEVYKEKIDEIRALNDIQYMELSNMSHQSVADFNMEHYCNGLLALSACFASNDFSTQYETL